MKTWEVVDLETGQVVEEGLARDPGAPPPGRGVREVPDVPVRPLDVTTVLAKDPATWSETERNILIKALAEKFL